MRRFTLLHGGLATLILAYGAVGAAADDLPAAAAAAGPAAKAEAARLDAQSAKPPPGAAIKIDLSGAKESGRATYYGPVRGRRRTASGRSLDPRAHIAASKSLPLGSIAKVTNLETGKSDVVTIEDRVPFRRGRVIDVTRGVAAQIGLDKKEGVAPVVVAPLTVPQPDGSVKLGAGGAEPVHAPARPDGPATPK